MGAIQPPQPVKLICGVLFNHAVVLGGVEEALTSAFGDVDVRSPIWPFRYTSYYDEETGPDIQRAFFAFRRLADPEALPDAKVQTNALEDDLAKRLNLTAPRPVNLDPGYVDKAKLVLATTKDYNHRVYLRAGVYAEVTLHYRKRRFEPWPWTYPDYRSAEYVEFFDEVRKRYIAQCQRDER